MIKQGDVLNGTYQIKGILGSGGGGIIYQAHHLRLKTDVVVKQIRDEVKGHIEGRAEADVLKRLRHSHLPRVYDFLEMDGEIYTVMEMIPGINLAQALKDNGGAFPQQDVVRWAGELADALKYLHSMKPPIIHSDIKPSNIMLQPDGHVCLIDFNISLALDNAYRTSTGISDGFAPPEQYHSREMYNDLVTHSVMRSRPSSGETETETANARGGDETLTAGRRDDDSDLTSTASGRRTESAFGAASTDQNLQTFTASNLDGQTASILNDTFGKGVDERSDIYSLGATLYMLATGIKPSSRYWEIIPINQLERSGRGGTKISQGLSTIIKKCMELDPEQRYQNGGALKNAMDHIRDLDDTVRKHKAAQRTGTVLTLMLLAVSIALVAGGYMVMQRERLNAYNSSMLEAADLILSEDFDKAGETIAAAQELIPERIDAYEGETRRLYEMGDYEGCIRYGMECINSPKYALSTETDNSALGNIYYLLGNAYFDLADDTNAISCFHGAIQQWCENGAYYRDLAIALARSGNTQEAEEVLEEAKQKSLGEDSIYMVQGEIAYGNGDYERSITLFHQVLSSTDNDEIIRRTVFLCADAYRQMDSSYYREEIEFLTSYEYTLGGHSAQLTEMLAEAYVKAGDTEHAILKFKELIEKGYASFRTYENLAILQHESGDFGGAMETLSTMKNQYPNRYETFKRLAFLEADIQSQKPNSERDYRQTKEYYDQAVTLCETDDPEMQRLTVMMQDLIDGGWF